MCELEIEKRERERKEYEQQQIDRCSEDLTKKLCGHSCCNTSLPDDCCVCKTSIAYCPACSFNQVAGHYDHLEPDYCEERNRR